MRGSNSLRDTPFPTAIAAWLAICVAIVCTFTSCTSEGTSVGFIDPETANLKSYEMAQDTAKFVATLAFLGHYRENAPAKFVATQDSVHHVIAMLRLSGLALATGDTMLSARNFAAVSPMLHVLQPKVQLQHIRFYAWDLIALGDYQHALNVYARGKNLAVSIGDSASLEHLIQCERAALLEVIATDSPARLPMLQQTHEDAPGGPLPFLMLSLLSGSLLAFAWVLRAYRALYRIHADVTQYYDDRLRDLRRGAFARGDRQAIARSMRHRPRR